MRRPLFILCLMALSRVALADSVPTTVASDLTLDVAGSPWHITGNTQITSGHTLTIDPGVELIVDGNYYLLVDGCIQAAGTAVDPITIDGTGGAGSWREIQFRSSGLSSSLAHVSIRNGGSLSSVAQVAVTGHTLTMDHCTISDSAWDGISVSTGGNLSMNTCSVENTRYPLSLNTSAMTLNLTGTNGLVNNDYPQIYCNFGILSQDIQLDSNTDVAYHFASSVTIPVGRTLSLAAGTVLKMAISSYLYVHGSFACNGTALQNNWITSIRDDNVLGDTNGDGPASSPAAANWQRIYYYGDSNDAGCTMEYTTVRFGTSAIYTENAGPSFDNCLFSNSTYPLHMTGVSTPNITNCNFAVATNTPIYMSLSSLPVMSGNDFSTSNNGYDAIGIIPETLSSNGFLPVRNFTSVPNVTYVVAGNITVPSGLALTVDPGVVVKFTSASYGLSINSGTLNINGTLAQPVTFTSVKDDNWGNPADTNNDGSITSPAAGDWRGIAYTSSTGGLDHLNIRYAGGYWHTNLDGMYRWAAVGLFDSSPTIADCDFFDNNDHGLMIFGNSNPVVSDCTFSNHDRSPITMSVAATPTFSNIVYSNNAWTSLGILGEYLGTSCTLFQRSLAGYGNITYLLEDDLRIDSGTHLIIDPGVVLKVRAAGVDILVDGSLEAVGTLTDPVVITSLKDDNHGDPADTNNDGSATSPSYSNWGSIDFRATADDPNCHISNALISYGGTSSDGAIRCENSAPTIDNSILTANYFGVSIRGTSAPTISDCTIQSSQSTPIYMAVTSNPVISFNNTFVNNGYFALGIISEPLTVTATLPQRNVAGVNNFTYLFLTTFIIQESGHLIMDEGVVAKFLTYGNISVLGDLSMLGQVNNRVVLTSVLDDAVGGDTNEDGSGTSPSVANWGWITFQESSGNNSVLEHAVVRYGGWAGQYYGLIRCLSASPEVRNCEITNGRWGLDIIGAAAPIVEDNTFVNMDVCPVRMSLVSTPSFSGNQFFNVEVQAVEIYPEALAVNTVLQPMDFGGYTNITRYLSGTLTVNSTTHLDIDPGVVIKCASATVLVNGSLAMDGVTLVGLADDTVGNPLDTQDNGLATTPLYTNWNGVQFADISVDANCLIENSEFRHAYSGVKCTSASPTINNSLFDNCQHGVFFDGNSQPVMNTVTIDNSQYSPVYQSLVSNVDYSSTVFGYGNGYQGIGIKGETLAQNISMVQKSSDGIANLVYVLEDNLTVGSSAELSIAPGIVIKGVNGRSILVHKGINAIGGSDPDQQIIFTHIADDYYGGDTNTDGNATSPSRQNNAIYVDSDSWDALCNFDWCMFRYWGYGNTYGAIDANSASPSITNCSFTDGNIGVSCRGASNPVISGCDFINNLYYGVKNTNTSITVVAENNWWGDSSGPLDASDDTGNGGFYNPGGLGDVVSDYVDYEPWTTVLQLPRLGDVSLNGEIHAYDASLVLSHLVGGIVLTPLQLAVADVTGDGVVDAVDPAYILQYVVGSLTTFPGELSATPEEPFDPDTELDAQARPEGDGWVLELQLTGENTLKGFEAHWSIDDTALEIVDVSCSQPGVTLRWHSEAGELRVALATLSPLEEALQLQVHVLGAQPVESLLELEGAWVNGHTLGASTEVASELPASFKLYPNWPNPFNPATHIAFDLPQAQNLSLTVYNIAGQRVRSLHQGPLPAGHHELRWDGTNQAGLGVASGVYILSLESATVHGTLRMTLLK
ncbi:MAG: right-handed parallel beta-helix repeat-containing protein [Candidatus Delongbacteria bacterium]|nr:right-handed parallel beta-helix repeat-containing protein [Candidatus Delongbacteria bacterium]